MVEIQKIQTHAIYDLVPKFTQTQVTEQFLLDQVQTHSLSISQGRQGDVNANF